MKAARSIEYHKSLVPDDVPVPDVQADEALVGAIACGMCRFDSLLVDGFFQSYGDIPRPVIPSHEITGTIENLGGVVPKAASLEEGDHVVVSPGWGDGAAAIASSAMAISNPMCVGPVPAPAAGLLTAFWFQLSEGIGGLRHAANESKIGLRRTASRVCRVSRVL